MRRIGKIDSHYPHCPYTKSSSQEKKTLSSWEKKSEVSTNLTADLSTFLAQHQVNSHGLSWHLEGSHEPRLPANLSSCLIQNTHLAPVPPDCS